MRPLSILTACLLALATFAGGEEDAPGILPGEGVPDRITVIDPPPGERADLPGILPGEQVPERVFLPAQAAAEPSVDWGVVKIGAQVAWKTTKGRLVRVAVLDTGCDLTHPNLKGAIMAARDFTGSPSGPSDVNGHGTHCAGVVGARTDGAGLLGVAPECSILVAKVLGDSGSGSDFSISGGIDWSLAAAQNTDVISMSLGARTPSQTIHAAVKRADAEGVIVVAAAGNEGPGQNTVGYPGGFVECVCVAATDSTDAVARFSSRGQQVFVAGPGVNVRSTYPGGRYATMSGTSMATPHLAGVAALWIAANPTVPKKDRPAKFKAALVAACKDLGTPGRDTAYGHGLVDCTKLIGGPPIVPPPAGGWAITEGDLTPDALGRFRARFPGATLRLEIGLPGAPGVPMIPTPPQPEGRP